MIYDFDGRDGITEADSRRVYESMKESFMYEKFLNCEIDSEISYSFWVTSDNDLCLKFLTFNI